jgi:glycosyltransferase involved in cell wall biosynthesis
MKVTLVDPSLFTWPYDAALAEGLRQAGNQVSIIGKALQTRPTGPASALLHETFYRHLAGANVKRLPRPVFLALKGLSHVRGLRRLQSALAKAPPDVIHFQWTPLPLVDRQFIPAFRRIAPTVLTVHDSAPFNGNPRSRLQMMGAVAIMQQFDRLVVHTEAAAKRLEAYGLPRRVIRCIAHGPLDVFEPALANKIPGERIRVLLFGRIKPYKGADVLLRAAAALPRDVLHRCQIDIVGEPHMDLTPLHDLIRDHDLAPHVRIDPRFIAESEIPGLLASADIVALPYREIDASGVLMASLAAGLPIVATRVGLFAEMLQDGKHGRLIPVDDANALAAALQSLVLDPELRLTMGANVRALRDQIPSWREIGETTTRLYRELVATGSVAATSRPLVPPQSDPSAPGEP